MSDAILRKYTEDEILAEFASDREMFLIEQDAMRIRYENELAEKEKSLAEKEKSLAEKDKSLAEKDQEHARNMKAAGIDAEIIAKCIGLTVEEINEL